MSPWCHWLVLLSFLCISQLFIYLLWLLLCKRNYPAKIRKIQIQITSESTPATNSASPYSTVVALSINNINEAAQVSLSLSNSQTSPQMMHTENFTGGWAYRGMIDDIIFLFRGLELCGSSGKLECEDLPIEDCAFSVSSSGARCVLEKYRGKDATMHVECQVIYVLPSDSITKPSAPNDGPDDQLLCR